MFLDEVTVRVRSGRGGPGAVSFRHEKYVPRGGPDGGDGGRGGDVVLVATAGLNSLSHFHGRRMIAAHDGGRGTGGLKHGADAEAVRVSVPVGTVVLREDEEPMGELISEGGELVVARGGRGGRGNARFAHSRDQAPRFAELGDPGEELDLKLELRLLADVGVVGTPNAGKSTLLAALTSARPKIAGYAFSTLEPNLGVAELEDGDRFTIADVPGLIEGAHEGAGLGTAFLKHLKRTSILVQVVDIAEPLEKARQARRQVLQELGSYDPQLEARVRIVALNKVDVPRARERAARLQAELAGEGVNAIPISAIDGVGVDELLVAIGRELDEGPVARPEGPVRIYRPAPRRRAIKVEREQDAFVVSGRAVETIIARTDLDNPSATARMRAQLETAGLREALLKAGAEGGDTIVIGGHEFLFDPEL